MRAVCRVVHAWGRVAGVPADVFTRPDKAAGTSLIFNGAFNPAIFQPAWLMRHGLIADDADSVELEAVTTHITSWGQAWLKVVVQPERCEFHATDEVASYKTLHDLAVGVFDLLPHVPITAFGVNRFAHFQMESEDAWNALGFSLFSRDRWEGALDDPRMRSLTVENRHSDGGGRVRVQTRSGAQWGTPRRRPAHPLSG